MLWRRLPGWRFIVAWLGLVLSFSLLAPLPASGEESPSIAATVMILVDEHHEFMGLDSDLYKSLQRVLNINKIKFETITLSKMANFSVYSEDKLARYSVLVLMAPGWKIDRAGSEMIARRVKLGLGLVGLLSDSANEWLAPLFGITELGKEWRDAAGLAIRQDKFTFSYQGKKIAQPVSYLNHKLAKDADVIAGFIKSDFPAVWTYQYGAGKTVFQNSNAVPMYYQGILLQSILYAMPVGVASPINVGVIEVDDCPRSFASRQELQEWHYNFLPNFLAWLKAYNFRASFFTAFSYSGNIDDFWKYNEGLEAARMIAEAGYELGIHCGSKHTPLDTQYWTDQASINAEAGKLAEAFDKMREQLAVKSAIKLGGAVSYAAPGNSLGKAGYLALDEYTDIRYVGVGYSRGLDIPHPDSPFPPTFREYGAEAGTGIYNVPRYQASFFRMAESDEAAEWSIMRALMESGDTYVAFTHPDELDLPEYDGNERDMARLFDAYEKWADYVTRYYPYYRWWTHAELGRYLEKRRGVIEAEWFPKEMTLYIKNAQPDDTIHIKSELSIESISKSGDTMVIRFRKEPVKLTTRDFDIVNLGNDTYICPPGMAKTHAAAPLKAFVYRPNPALPMQTDVATQQITRLVSQAYIYLAAAGAIFLAGLVAILRLHK